MLKFKTVNVAIGIALVSVMSTTSCSRQPQDASLSDLSVADGLTVDVVVDAVTGPTQIEVIDADTLLVAAINGKENGGTGVVVAVDLEANTKTTWVDRLDKPTGVAWLNDEVWIMERDRLSRGTPLGQRSVVADNLPNNGRSQGTLTVTDDEQILFNTSGSKQGSEVADGSGRLFLVDPADPDAAPEELASGFKNAYGHVFDEDGQLWVTEISDGTFDGAPAADELVPVERGMDHGWPTCVGDNRPVTEFGATSDTCQSIPRPLALFEAGATPTSVVESPFEANSFLVSLWLEGRVVSVSTDNPGRIEDVVTGLAGPQHLAVEDGSVYLSEFGANRILRIAQP